LTDKGYDIEGKSIDCSLTKNSFNDSTAVAVWVCGQTAYHPLLQNWIGHCYLALLDVGTRVDDCVTGVFKFYGVFFHFFIFLIFVFHLFFYLFLYYAYFYKRKFLFCFCFQDMKKGWSVRVPESLKF